MAARRPRGGERKAHSIKYNSEHRRLRENWKRRIEAGEAPPCARCGKPITGAFDLGHVDGGPPGAHSGPEHRSCNRASMRHARLAAGLPVSEPEPPAAPVSHPPHLPGNPSRDWTGDGLGKSWTPEKSAAVWAARGLPSPDDRDGSALERQLAAMDEDA